MKISAWIRLLVALLLVTTVLGGRLYYLRTVKKSYDYSAYYVPKTRTEPADVTVLPKENDETELSLELLKRTNSDIVGILEFPGRVIYEPFVQAKDDEYYLRRNIEGKYSAAGIAFVSGGSSLDSTNILIYGHSGGRDAVVFTPLMNYTDKEYYRKNPKFIMRTFTGDREYTIFSVLNIDPKDRGDTLEFTRSSWRKEEDYEAFLNDMRKRSLYDTGVSVSVKDRILTLVTCDTRDNSKRIVVIAKETNREGR
jgi:sortase B